MGLEIFFGIFYIFRALAGCFKLKRGILRQLFDKSIYTAVLRGIVLVYLTNVMISFVGKVCFCGERYWFHEHCYFGDEFFDEYQCYFYAKS